MLLATVANSYVFAQEPPSARGQTSPISAEEVRTALVQKFPATAGSRVTPAFFNFYRVTKGNEVGFVSDDLRYLIRGEVFDLASGISLNPAPDKAVQPEQAITKIDINRLPLADAIRIGSGKKKLFVFSDPDCPYCKKFELTLAALKDVSVFVFQFPLEQIHPNARKVSTDIWCRPEALRGSVWRNYLVSGIYPKVSTAKDCQTPIDRNLQLGSSLGIRGTPAVIFEDGSLQMGAMDVARTQYFLDRATSQEGGK